MRIRTLLATLAFVSTALCLAASPALPAPGFLTTDAELIVAAIPPPPAVGSIADMADVETLLQIQKDRTSAQVERAVSVEDFTLFSRDSAGRAQFGRNYNAENQYCMFMGGCVFGPKFSKENLPRTYAFLKKTTRERYHVSMLAKTRWERARPFDRGIGVEKCVPTRPEGASYPSGHSSCAALWETLLGEALPEYKTLFTEVRREIQWARVLAGVHYPTDTQAGCLLGHLVAREMLKNQRTRDAVAEMRAEILDFLQKNPDAAPKPAAPAKNQGSAQK